MITRRLQLQQGEDLRAIALRELGDAARWVEIARLNALRLPFIVDSYKATDRLPRTLIWGDDFLVPATQHATRQPTANLVLGRDLALMQGALQVSGGDLMALEGADTIVQAVAHRIKTLRGELTYHPRFGSSVQLALGLPAGRFASMMAAGWVYEALQAEPRVATIEAVDANISGDIARVAARVVIVGRNTATDLNLVLNA